MLLAGSSAPLVVHDSTLLRDVDVSQVQNAVPRPHNVNISKVQNAVPRPHNVDISKVQDAVPRPHYGPLKTSPYRLAGVFYQPMKSAAGFQQEGIASWYGTRFHGRKTANGEIYNMYAMTAAHKTLPLPSYVRVTNKANGRSVVVRVNDRGPFHGNRVIDLSYVAAKKLGFHNRGTTRVVIEAIDTARSAPRGKPVQQVARARTTGKAWREFNGNTIQTDQYPSFPRRTTSSSFPRRITSSSSPRRITSSSSPRRIISSSFPRRRESTIPAHAGIQRKYRPD